MDKIREHLRKFPLGYLFAALIGGTTLGATVDSPSYLDKVVAMPENTQVCADWVRSKQPRPEVIIGE